ncbi:glycerol phosphate lipoteichoic acid synthase [Pradoshia eiseniae]|uniref:Glycerol phosphate lipoteichoic acid synthase n=1 Tax=Pradoshia eiseniae TaxID=2064768 RepID=A0A2S7MVV0_9BACI|nr:LTA synthase family protein [Pradoshia eiseniae]PQD93875.1 glycerol phosphate lipoteichoic acid synthase [Pradoshia eiseniae]
MKTIKEKFYERIDSQFGVFYLIAVLTLWMKTYLVQVTQFDLGVQGILQQFLLLLNPLGSALLLLGLAWLFKGRGRYTALMILYFLSSFLLFANVMYYRFFNDFITLPTLFQTQNFGDVSGSILTLIKPYDFLFFLDFVLFLVLLLTKRIKVEKGAVRRRAAVSFMGMGLAISGLNLVLAEADRPQLLTRGFDRNYIVKYLGMYNYTVYDAVQSTRASAQRVLADSNDITEVVNFTSSNHAMPNPEYFGKAEGMNVILIHLESIQEFLIDYELNGEEVTPFLNSLTEDKNMMYFDNFFHQTAQGKTSDAEFILSNSLYGLPQGSAFTMKGTNTYQAAPAILGQEGYTSAVFHPNTGSFWNRNEIYKSFGYDRFFDASSYEMDPEHLADYGLMDKPFFEQSIPNLESLPEPFYAKFISVTHHYPFSMDQDETTIEPHTTGDKSVDNYFQTARYADEALEQFFDYLKESGLYDNSMIIMYGDHYGISQNHDVAMEKVLEKEVTPFVSKAELQRVPFFIRVPGMEGGIRHTYGGQIDILPTILHLLGKESKDYIQFGTDLLSEEHDEVVPFRNGDFVSPTITAIDEKFYDSETGLPLEEERLNEAKRYHEAVQYKLELSDRVVNGDLLRFHTPDDFEPVDRSEYDYNLDLENQD